jgi:hypothetical protein
VPGKAKPHMILPKGFFYKDNTDYQLASIYLKAINLLEIIARGWVAFLSQSAPGMQQEMEVQILEG